jgi:hypothetical protein
MSSMDSIRQRIIEIAERSEGLVGPAMTMLAGLTGSDWERDLYRPFIFRDGKSQGVSTCGLVAEGVWHAAGVAVPSTWRPYSPEREVEKAIARAIEFARAYQAVRRWDSSKPMELPGDGDYCVIGSGLRTHALTCITLGWGDWTQRETSALPFDDVTGLGLINMMSIDGGQVCERTGLQKIKRKIRTFARSHDKLLLRGETDSRELVLWIDVSALPVK